MRVLILAEAGRGQSTLAALVAKALAAYEIPHEVIDAPGMSADDLLKDDERLRRNALSIAGREKVCGGKVVVEVRPINATPHSNPEVT